MEEKLTYTAEELLRDPDVLIALLTALKAEREKRRRLEEMIAIGNQQILELKAKLTYYDVVLNCKAPVPISVIARDYGWSVKKMFQYLHEKGIQYKQGRIWLLHQEYAERGFTHTVVSSYPDEVRTYWTQAGRLFVYDLMKADGNLPLIEQTA